MIVKFSTAERRSFNGFGGKTVFAERVGVNTSIHFKTLFLSF